MCRHCYHKKCVIWSTHLNIPCYQEICYLRHSWYESSIFKAYNPRGNTVVTTIHTIGVSSSQLITFTGKLLRSYLVVFQHTAACCYWKLLVEQNLSVERFNKNSSFTGCLCSGIINSYTIKTSVMWHFRNHLLYSITSHLQTKTKHLVTCVNKDPETF